MAEKEKRPEISPIILESGIEVKPVYGPQDMRDIDYERDIGEPGKFPFTRGIHELMYRVRPFTMRQYAGFGTPRETNERFKYLIEHGQNALNVAFDLPTQNGLDSDDPHATGEVGRVGMAVDTLKDMEDAFDGIDLSKISTSLTINPIASMMIAMYYVVAEKQGVTKERVAGTAQNDILKEYVGRGTWIFAIEPSIRLIVDTIEFCAKELPRYNPVSVCGYHIRESGADPVQEMAYAFLIAKEYAQRAIARGLPVDSFAGRLSFNFDIHGNFFEQIAKFRAGRRLWAKIAKDELGAKDPRSMHLRMIAGGGGGGLTIEEPENNIVRAAYYALASALSGTQTMALCCYDEAYTIPSEKASLIALRTMQILQEEVGVCDSVDPLAGSYYVESLTNEMEKRIVAEMKRIEELGGIVKCIENGYIQKLVSLQAYEEEKAIRSGKIPKVAVNKYVTGGESSPTLQCGGRKGTAVSPEVKLHQFNPQVQEAQIKRLADVKAKRDKSKVEKSLEVLREKAVGTENLMPYILDCVRAYCTVGEMTKVFKSVFGEFKEPIEL
jgi:methylmalonyl-CoA mutase N-terminal domain/subunit